MVDPKSLGVKRMSILHVRNVPDELYLRLKRRARAQRRSLSAEVLTLLEWAVQQTERSPEVALTSIRRRRFFDPAAIGAPDSTMLLREDRDR
jgi:plasmid stability protein